MHQDAARAAIEEAPANERHLGANGYRRANAPITGSAMTREHNGSIVLPNRAIRGHVGLRTRSGRIRTCFRRQRC